MDSLTDPRDDTMPVVIAPDTTRLLAFLCEREYSQHAREVIARYVRDCGTLEGCEYLDPEDRAAADELLEAAWPPVASTSHAWDEDTWHGRPSRWTIAAGAPVPPELDVDPEFVPSEEDEAFYAAWSAAVEAELDAHAALMPESFPADF